MKKVEAIIKPFKIEEVREALSEVGPLGFVLAPPKELTAYCSACASAYNPLAARLPARIARSLAHVNRSSSERNPTESTALLAQLMEIGTCDSDCARPTCHLLRPQSCPYLN